MAQMIAGRDIKEGTRIKTWFMPKGTAALSFGAYCGPLSHLWPAGARIIGFNAATSSGAIAMTVGNDELLTLAD